MPATDSSDFGRLFYGVRRADLRDELRGHPCVVVLDAAALTIFFDHVAYVVALGPEAQIWSTHAYPVSNHDR